jgi:ferritin-like metal-binding protein YciE
MGLFIKNIRSMDDLFLHTLSDIYYTERQIIKTLPNLISKTTNPELAAGFRHHLDETKHHVSRLEEVFRHCGQEPKDVDCPAIDGILDEAEEIASEIDDKAVLDAALIAAAQAVEHYEITRYGTLIAWANQRGDTNVASLLKRTLDEERRADEKLTSLAESKINQSTA